MGPGKTRWANEENFASLPTHLCTAGLEQMLNFKIWLLPRYLRIHIMSRDLQARKVTILAELVIRKREGYALVSLAQWLEP